MPSFQIGVAGITKLIKALNIHKAAGPDLINGSKGTWSLADPGGHQGRAAHLGVQILSFSCSFWQKFEK